jgi:hypothetical protein
MKLFIQFMLLRDNGVVSIRLDLLQAYSKNKISQTEKKRAMASQWEASMG